MFHDFNAASFHNFFFNFGFFFSLIWFLLKSYNIIITLSVHICWEKTFNGSKRNFSEKSVCYKWLRQFLSIFWFLTVFVVYFLTMRLNVIAYWWPMIKKYHSIPVETWPSVFKDFLWKLFNLMSLILPVFRKKNFVVLIYLFIFVNFLRTFFLKKGSLCCWKIIELKLLLKSSLFNGSDTFLSFFYFAVCDCSFCSRKKNAETSHKLPIEDWINDSHKSSQFIANSLKIYDIIRFQKLLNFSVFVVLF